MNTVTTADACHLARRTGFAASSKQVDSLLREGTASGAIAWLMAQPPSLLPLPTWHDDTPENGFKSERDPQARRRLRRQQVQQLKFWWMQQMLNNSSPLQEKMTLFWANHFTSSARKVKLPQAMLRQNLLLREGAMGSFRDLLAGIIKDPAMLLYLDNAASKRQAPNENFARELLELFTLGEGNYTETDVRELARVLTGASVDRRTGQYRFRRRWHDPGSKTLFGETGRFQPADAVDIILRQPSTGPFIASKLWQFFIDDNPPAAALTSLGQIFVDSDYHLTALLQALLERPEFWTSQGQKIKSPMELLVGSAQLFELPLPKPWVLLAASVQMGQDLFEPPSVAGWAEGRAWYDSSNLSSREQVIQFIIQAAPTPLPLEQMLAIASASTLPARTQPDYLATVLQDPAYQVV